MRKGGKYIVSTHTLSLQAEMVERRSTCMMQKGGCLHRMSSSCMTSWGGWSPSAPSQSPEHPAPDQTPKKTEKVSIYGSQ